MFPDILLIVLFIIKKSLLYDKKNRQLPILFTTKKKIKTQVSYFYKNMHIHASHFFLIFGDTIK